MTDHTGNVIPVPTSGRVYSYENEPVHPVLTLRGRLLRRGS